MTARNPDTTYEAMSQALRFFEEQLCKKVHTAIPGIILNYCLLYTSPSPRDS